MSQRINIRGVIHNSLLPLRVIATKNSHAIWKCKCLKCGKATYPSYSNIVSGNSKSCVSCGQKVLSKKQDKEIALLYTKQHLSLTQLASIYHCSCNTVRNALIREKVTRRRRGGGWISLLRNRAALYPILSNRCLIPPLHISAALYFG